MVNNSIKCGNSNAVYNATPVAKPDTVTRRKTVPIHFGTVLPPAGGFRLVVRLTDGREAILALADSREDALLACRARTTDLPENAARLVLDRWEGTRLAGRWVKVATGPGDLPRPAPPLKGRNRLGRRERKWFGE